MKKLISLGMVTGMLALAMAILPMTASAATYKTEFDIDDGDPDCVNYIVQHHKTSISTDSMVSIGGNITRDRENNYTTNCQDAFTVMDIGTTVSEFAVYYMPHTGHAEEVGRVFYALDDETPLADNQ